MRDGTMEGEAVKGKGFRSYHYFGRPRLLMRKTRRAPEFSRFARGRGEAPCGRGANCRHLRPGAQRAGARRLWGGRRRTLGAFAATFPVAPEGFGAPNVHCQHYFLIGSCLKAGN